MAHGWRLRVEMQGANPVLQALLLVGDTLMLTEVLQPGIDDEIFEEVPRPRRVLHHPPLHCAVAPTGVSEQVEVMQELLAIRLLDDVFHRHE